MILAIFICLEELPITSNGKVDRYHLPLPRLQSRSTTLLQPVEYPRTPLEWEIALTWQSILHIDDIGIHDDFYELGGDSVRLIALYIANLT